MENLGDCKKMKCWKKTKSKNPYVPHTWINKSKMQMLEVHYDIGFGKQRNAIVYDLKDKGYTGFKPLKTHYGKNTKDALKFAKDYMERNDTC